MSVTSADKQHYDAEFIFQRLLAEASTDSTGVAEVKLFGSTFNVNAPRRIGSLEAAQNYVKALSSLPVMRERYPRLQGVTVTNSRSQSTYHWYHRTDHKISLIDSNESAFDNGRLEYVLLHECAHAANADLEGDSHGESFQEILLDLVSIAMSDEHAYILRMLFAENKQLAG